MLAAFRAGHQLANSTVTASIAEAGAEDPRSFAPERCQHAQVRVYLIQHGRLSPGLTPVVRVESCTRSHNNLHEKAIVEGGSSLA